MRPPTGWGCEPLWPSLCQEEQTAALSGRGAGSSSPIPDLGGQRPRAHGVGVEIQAVLAGPPPPMCSCAFKGPPNLSVPQFPLVQSSIHEGIHPSTDSGIVLKPFFLTHLIPHPVCQQACPLYLQNKSRIRPLSLPALLVTHLNLQLLLPGCSVILL